MLKSFEEMSTGDMFYNSFTHTACLKIAHTKYYDFTVKHCIKMRKELRQHKHLTGKLLFEMKLEG